MSFGCVHVAHQRYMMTRSAVDCSNPPSYFEVLSNSFVRIIDQTKSASDLRLILNYCIFSILIHFWTRLILQISKMKQVREDPMFDCCVLRPARQGQPKSNSSSPTRSKWIWKLRSLKELGGGPGGRGRRVSKGFSPSTLWRKYPSNCTHLFLVTCHCLSCFLCWQKTVMSIWEKNKSIQDSYPTPHNKSQMTNPANRNKSWCFFVTALRKCFKCCRPGHRYGCEVNI